MQKKPPIFAHVGRPLVAILILIIPLIITGHEDWVVTGLKVFLGFSALIVIHELGHFLVAKKSGVLVEEFGWGLPPRIWGKKIGETLYSLNWLPIGGFVKLHGETAEDKVVYPERAFANKSALKKIAISVAGIIMNFLFAILCFAIVYSINGIDTGVVNVKIISVTNDTPAAAAGIVSGDIIKKVADKTVANGDEFKSELAKYLDKPVNLEVLRSDKTLDLQVTPRSHPPKDQGALGVEIGDFPIIYYPPVWQRPFVGAWYGLKQTVDITKAVFLGLGGAAKSVSQGQAPQHLVGAVGIFSLFIEFAKLGILPLLNLMGIISVNLAVVNILPIPPLDGSRILLTTVEGLTKKKMTPSLEGKVYTAGFVFMIALMLLITAKEIPALIKSGSLNNFVQSLITK